MTKEQALALLERVQREAPGVQATFDTSRVRKNGQGYHVKLQCQGRIMQLNKAQLWEEIKDAWHGFLFPEDISPAPPRTPPAVPRYLVDGTVMTIGLSQGYWRGSYRDATGHYRRKHFGKVDPRPNFQVLTESEDSHAQ